MTQIARFMGPTWGPPGSCRPLVGPINLDIRGVTFCSCMCYQWNWPESTLSNDVPYIRRICDLNNVSLFIFLLEDTQTLSRLHKYLYETFRTRASISTGGWSKWITYVHTKDTWLLYFFVALLTEIIIIIGVAFLYISAWFHLKSAECYNRLVGVCYWNGCVCMVCMYVCACMWSM